MQTQSRLREERTNFGTYREYSRRRYTELRELYGDRMRQSEIIQRIIREWDEMKSKKDRSAGRSSEAVSTPAKQEESMVPLEIKEIKDNLKLKSTSAKKEEEGKAKEMEEVNVRPFDDLSMERSKPIRKAKAMNTYIRFFKETYQILSQKHPNWTAAEITTIIKLLWRREKKSHMGKLKAPREVPLKKLSGRMFFKRFKLKDGMNKKAIVMKWKRLPMDSKRMYETMGNPEARITHKPTAITINATAKQNCNINKMLSKK